MEYLWALVYLVGCVLSYGYNLGNLGKTGDVTKPDKIFSVFAGLFSWAGVLVAALTALTVGSGHGFRLK